MSKCDQCGNEYDHGFEVRAHGTRYYFDCFECAIQKLAPVCEHCSCRIIGHGVEGNGAVFWCAHCAREAGVKGVSDRSSVDHAHH